jgi:hypothetical protein
LAPVKFSSHPARPILRIFSAPLLVLCTLKKKKLSSIRCFLEFQRQGGLSSLPVVINLHVPLHTWLIPILTSTSLRPRNFYPIPHLIPSLLLLVTHLRFLVRAFLLFCPSLFYSHPRLVARETYTTLCVPIRLKAAETFNRQPFFASGGIVFNGAYRINLETQFVPLRSFLELLLH